MKVIVNLALFAEGRTCFVKYADMPDHQKGWFVPHVALTEAEDPMEACKKIAREQLGINTDEIQPQVKDIQSFTGNDGSWHLSFDYVLQLPQAQQASPATHVAKLEWFPISQLPERVEVAHHGWGLDIVEKML
jgi:ADP-ribose pyrophosphatase YjhB (NUDIX family)